MANRAFAVFRIAARHLRASPRTVALTVAGVGVGVAVFVFTVAMMDGLVVFFSSRILRVSPTLTVLPEKAVASERHLRGVLGSAPAVVVLSRPPVPDERSTIRGALGLASELRRLPLVEGVSPIVATAAIASFGTAQESASLLGVDPDAEPTVTEVHRYLRAGSWNSLSLGGRSVLLGFRLAERLGVGVGDRVILTGETGASKDVEVGGILAVGIGTWDENTVVAPLALAQSLAGWGSDEASGIRLRTPLAAAPALGHQIQRLTGWRVETWEETNRAALQLFRTIGTTTYLLTGFILVVAGLGIANKLVTMILDRERDIAILRAYGFSRGAIRSIFLAQGLLLAGAGALAGCLGAYLLIWFFQRFPIRFTPGENAPLAYTELYLSNKPSYYLVIAGVSMAVAALASLLAVRRAAKVMPSEVLRGQV